MRATFSTTFKISTQSMYEIQVTRVKLTNFISSSKFLNNNQMLICLFPSMHFYALHLLSFCAESFVFKFAV